MEKNYAKNRKPLLWLLVCLLFPVLMVSAQLNSTATMGKMFIDADVADWAGIPSDTAKVFNFGETNWVNAADFQPTFKTAWDKKFLYFYTEIKDDIRIKKGNPGTGASYQLDNIELWLDVDNSKAAAFDGKDDIKIRINRDTTLVAGCPTCNDLGDYPWASGLGMKGMIVKQKEVTGGYIIEVAIPWDSIEVNNLVKPVIGAGTIIGFNAYFCDQDSINATSANRTKLVWQNTAGGSPATWGTLTLAGAPVETQLVANATQGKIIVDADASDWVNAADVPVAVVNYGANNLVNPADFSGSFKTSWDKKNLYFFANIKDDIKIKKGTSYLVDNFELSLDVNNSKGNAFDGVDDIKIRINRDTTLVAGCPTCNDLGDYPWANGLGMKGMVVKQKEVTGGYQVELSIPWDSIQSKNPSKVVIGENTKIGMQVYFCDQDSVNATGANRTKLLWVNAVAGKPATWADVVLAGAPVETQLVANATQVKIVVDGDATEWTNAADVPVAVVNYGANNLVNPADFSGSFKTTWDMKNLYFFADIKDDIKVKKGTSYLVDNFELSLDVNNSKGNAFDGVDDIKIRINRDTTLVAGCPTCNDLGDYPWANGLGMKGMVVKQKEVAGGYQVELSIPWDSIQSKNPSKVVIGENTKIGMQVYFCDQDSVNAIGANRTKLLWVNAVAGKPATWADVVLMGTPISAVSKIAATKFKVYPNPVKDILMIKNASDITLIDVYAINGRLINSYRMNAEENVQINATTFDQGLYLMKITSKDGSLQVTKFIKE